MSSGSKTTLAWFAASFVASRSPTPNPSSSNPVTVPHGYAAELGPHPGSDHAHCADQFEGDGGGPGAGMSSMGGLIRRTPSGGSMGGMARPRWGTIPSGKRPACLGPRPQPPRSRCSKTRTLVGGPKGLRRGHEKAQAATRRSHALSVRSFSYPLKGQPGGRPGNRLHRHSPTH
jgi:hypothetical protein